MEKESDILKEKVLFHNFAGILLKSIFMTECTNTILHAISIPPIQ